MKHADMKRVVRQTSKESLAKHAIHANTAMLRWGLAIVKVGTISHWMCIISGLCTLHAMLLDEHIKIVIS